MEEGSEGVSSGHPNVLVDVTDKNPDMIVDALTTTTSTTVSDDNKTSDVQNDDVNDCAMTEVCFDKAGKTNDQVPENMEFEVDLVPEKLSSENESAMAVEQETVEAEKSKENPDQSPEPGTSYETASSSSGEKLGVGMQRKKLTLRRFRASSNSSSDDDDDDDKEKNKEAAKEVEEGADKNTEARKSRKKRLKTSSSSSSSSSEHGSDHVEATGARPTTVESANDSSNDSFVSLESSEPDPDLAALFPGIDAARASGRNKPPERPEVLSKPAAKPKYSFLRDYNKLQLSGQPISYIHQSMAQLDLVRRFELSHKLKGHDGCVNSIHFNEGGNLLASGSDDLKIFIWDWEKKRKAYSFKSGHTQNVFQSKFIPFTGDTHLVTSSRDGQVRLAVLSSTGVCRSTKKVAQHSRAAHKLALLDSCPHTFISGGEDGLIISVDLREPKPTTLLTMRKSTRPVALYSVHANPANDFFICTAGKDSYVHIFDRRFMSDENPAPIKKFCPEHLAREESSLTNITCAVFNYDGTEIIASYNDEDIYLFNTDSNEGAEYVKRYQGHLNSATVKGVNFYGPKSEFVVSGSDCGNIFFWDKDTESIVHMVNGDKEGVVNCLEPHPNLPAMATSGLDHSVKIWLPTSTKEPDVKAIENTVMTNRRRDRFISGDRMLSVLWRHISWMQYRRREGRRGDDANPDNDDETDTGDEDDDDSDDSDDDDDDDEQVAVDEDDAPNVDD